MRIREAQALGKKHCRDSHEDSLSKGCRDKKLQGRRPTTIHCAKALGKKW